MLRWDIDAGTDEDEVVDLKVSLLLSGVRAIATE